MKRPTKAQRSISMGLVMIWMAAIHTFGAAIWDQALAAPEPQYGGVLNFHTIPLRSLDPHMETSGTTVVTNNTNNTLLRINPDMTGVEADLAKSWRKIDDRTYEFKIHEGVRFHDVPPVNGRELTSADVKYSLERVAGMHGKSADFKHRYYFEGKLESIETPDKYTLVIKTKQPYAAFLDYIASPWCAIVAKEVVDQHGDLRRQAIGTGPFLLGEYVQGAHITLTRNPHYFKKGLPYLDGLQIRIMTDPSSVVAAYISGRLDAAQVSYHFMPTIKEKVPDNQGVHQEGTHMWTLRFPPWIEGQKPLKAPFDKLEVRQAVAMAIDKKRLLELASGGFGTAQVGPVPQCVKYSLPPAQQIEYNPQKAKELLAKAGYPNGFSAELMTWNQPYMVRPAQVVQEMLKQIGVELKLNLLEMAQYFNKAYRFDYEMALHIMTAGVDPEEWLVPYFGPLETSTYYKWSNRDIWPLIDRQQHIMNPVEREALIEEIQLKVMADVPNVFLFTQHRFVNRKPYVHLRQRYMLDYQGAYGEDIWMDKH